MRTFRILGRLLQKGTLNGVSGLRVEAWDKDFLVDDFVGEAMSAGEGEFTIELDSKRFRELFLDRKPDLYFKVYEKDRLVRSTEEEVYWNAGAGDSHFDIEVPVESAPQKPPSEGEATIRGFVRWDDDGAAVCQATVRVADAETAKVLAEGKTDAKGAFNLRLGKIASAMPADLLITSAEGLTLATLKGGLRVAAGSNVVSIGADAKQRIPDKKAVRTVRIGAFDVVEKELAEARPEVLYDIASALVGRADKEAEARIARLSPELVPSRRLARTLCGTELHEAIDHIIRVKKWGRDVRLHIEDILRGRDDGFGPTEQISECPNFRVHYYTEGPDAVSTSTAAMDVIEPGGSAVLATLPAGGAPTYIKLICFWLERALAAYTTAPFSLRNPAASGKVEVYVNSGSFGSASPTTLAFYINKALPPDILCAVAVHELFHRVQYEYSGSGTWLGAMREGGATFAEDSAAERMNRYLDEAGTNFNGSGVMIQPHTSLETFAYKTSLFFRYIAEQHSPRINPGDEPAVGVETYAQLIEACEAGSWSSNDIRSAIAALPWYQDMYEFGYLDAERKDRTSAETTLGNFYLACYLKDLGQAVPDRRFDFMEDEENIAIDDAILASGLIPGSPVQGTLASVARTTDTLGTSGSITLASSVPRFGARFHEISVNSAVTNVQVAFTASAGLSSVIFQMVLIDEDNAVRDIIRSDKSSFTKRVTNLLDGKRLSKVLVVVTGATTGGSYTATVTPAAAAPDVMITRWHSVMKTEYEIDSRNWAWTWVSPDVWVDNDGDGTADGTVYFDYNNKLYIRLHNKGNLDASGISVQLWYQDASSGLHEGAWMPVTNKDGAVQTLSSLTLAAGASNQWPVDFSPSPSGTSQHFCIRAVVTVPGDPNTDNKRLLSNFGHVIAGSPGGFVDIRWIRRNADLYRRLVGAIVVPRLGAAWEVSRDDLRQLSPQLLDAREERFEVLRIRERSAKIHEHEDPVTHEPKGACGCASAQRRMAKTPDAGGHYAVDPRSLPPGVGGRPMVTVVQMSNGIPTGGVTFLVSSQKPRGEKPKGGAK